MYIFTITHLSIIYDYSYIRLGEPWGCFTNANVKLEWQSHSIRLSIELHKQMSSACGETGSWTPYLLHSKQDWYHNTTEPANFKKFWNYISSSGMDLYQSENSRAIRLTV